jgi:NhaP-type Na+/H+ or K+/H+ antiporter
VTAVLLFAVTLLLAVLVSELAHRSVLSSAVLFLAVGLVFGDSVLGVVSLHRSDPLVRTLAELALFSVLFTDGMRVGIRDLVSAWHLPGRALLLGLPLTLALTAVAGHVVAGLPWAEAFLLGAILSPTDPVFAAAIVGRQDVPHRLRHLLNVESGLNDGLALPVVVVMLAVVAGSERQIDRVAAELAAGIALGVAIPLVAIRLERTRFFSATTAYQPLNGFAIGLLVLAIAALTGANAFLAAFSAGVTVASVSPEVRDAFHHFGDLVTELLKLAAVMAFGLAIPSEVFTETGPGGYAFALVALLLIRPVALGLSLLGTRMPVREWVSAVWFGPKGFASVVYALLLFQRGIPGAADLFALATIVVTASIVVHSSTDVIVARWFREPERPSDLR